MMIYLLGFFNALISSFFIFMTTANAMKNVDSADLQFPNDSAKVIGKHFCDPLPSKDQVVSPDLRTPVASLMNLAPLYRLGLSGHGQIGAVIESGPLQIPPGMSGVIANSLQSYEKNDHASMVAQVVGSQIPGIGLAPGAKVFFGSSQAKVNGKISHSYADAVKLAIRAGAKAINLSFMQFRPEHFFQKGEADGKGKAVHYDFTSAIAYALKQGVPVFTSGGNNSEDLEATKSLKQIIKKSNVYNDELLVIAAGFKYPDVCFDRDDIIFAKNSARVNSDDFYLKRLMLAAPYKVKVYKRDFEKDIRVLGDDQRPLECTFSLQTVQGTSFSSPALMSVYLLLNEYVEREGNLLKAEDIVRCMRASAWQKPYPDEGEDLSWYGSGVVDGGRALEYCQLLIKARKLSQQQNYEESLQVWKTFLALLKGHAKGKYVLELMEIYRLSPTYKVIPLAAKEKALKEFYKDILSFWPEVYKGHHEDRLEAFMLFEKEKYKETRYFLDDIYKKTDSVLQKRSLAETALLSLLNKKDKLYVCSFMPEEKKFNAWRDSHIESELKNFIPYPRPKGVLFVEDDSPSGRLPVPLENIRDGYSAVSNYLSAIEKAWDKFEKLMLEDRWQSIDADIFLSSILDLSQKLKPFALPENLHRQLNAHVEKAKQEKEKMDKLKQKRS